MKILRYYWSAERRKNICDMVLSVVRETKTMYVAIDRMHPRYEYKFRKPKQYGNGLPIYPVGKLERFSDYSYEMELE